MKKLFNAPVAFLLVFTLGMLACRKDIQNSPGPVPPPMEIDTAKVKLKQYEITNLPSPYYQFVYNDSGCDPYKFRLRVFPVSVTVR